MAINPRDLNNTVYLSFDSAGIYKYSPNTGSYSLFVAPSSISNSDGLGFDSSGYLYATDTHRYVVQKISPSGAVTLFAGMVGVSIVADGVSGTFLCPRGLAMDSGNNLYVSDFNPFPNAVTGSLIRVVAPSGAITTLAGSSNRVGFTDGQGSNALFNTVSALAVDTTTGNLIISDTSNYAIRKMTPAGLVTTLAGGTRTGNSNGVGSNALFGANNNGYGLAINNGVIYASDLSSGTVRKILCSVPLSSGATCSFNEECSFGTCKGGEYYTFF